VEEEGVDKKTGKVVVKVDPRYFRPAEVECVRPIRLPLAAPLITDRQAAPREPG
jgi:hypothetical protein